MSTRTEPDSVENRWRRRLERFDPFLAPQLVAAATVVLDFALPDRLGDHQTGAGWLMSIQALTAPLTVGLIVARAANILS
jgi:hypothetical protein